MYSDSLLISRYKKIIYDEGVSSETSKCPNVLRIPKKVKLRAYQKVLNPIALRIANNEMLIETSG